VLSLGFGPRADELGYVPVGEHSPLPLIPRAFAVAADGSFWILDEPKRRIVRFTADGSYLEAIGGLRFDRFHPHPRDLVLVGDEPFVSEEFRVAATIRTRSAGGSLTSTAVVAEGKSVGVTELYDLGDSIGGWIGGYADLGPLGSGPHGLAKLDVPGDGEIHPVAGLPLAGGGLVYLENLTADDTMVLSATASRSSFEQPFRVVVQPGSRDPALATRRIAALIGVENVTALEDGVVALIKVTPDAAADAARYGGGNWLFMYRMNGDPLVWERLPDSTLSDEQLVRHIAVGPDGSIYLMLATPKGMVIYRRGEG
jgi:hypothetical protein